MQSELMEAGFEEASKLKGVQLKSAYDQMIAEQQTEATTATTPKKEKEEKKPPAALAAEGANALLEALEEQDSDEESLSNDDAGNKVEEAKKRATKGRPLGVTHPDNDYKVDVFHGGETPIVVEAEEMVKYLEEEVGHRIGASWIELACRCSKSDLKTLLEETGGELVDLLLTSGCCPSTTEAVEAKLFTEGAGTDDPEVVFLAWVAVDRWLFNDGLEGRLAHHFGSRLLSEIQKRTKGLGKLVERNQTTAGLQHAEPAPIAPRGAAAEHPGLFGAETLAAELNRNSAAAGYTTRMEEELEVLIEQKSRDSLFELDAEGRRKWYKGFGASNSASGRAKLESIEDEMRSAKPGSEAPAVSALLQLKPTRLSLLGTLQKADAVQGQEVGPLEILGFEIMLRRVDRASELGAFGGTDGLLSALLGHMNKVPGTIILENFCEVSDIWLNDAARLMLAAKRRLTLGEKAEPPRAAGELSEEARQEIKQLVASLNGEARRLKRQRLQEKGGQGSGASSSATSAGQPPREFCPFYLNDNCRDGANCKNPHLDKKDIKCPYLARGKCSKGNACDWKH